MSSKDEDLQPFCEQALRVARAIADERGWPWLEPVEVRIEARLPVRRWEITTNTFALGMNVRVVLREPDFDLVSAAFLPR